MHHVMSRHHLCDLPFETINVGKLNGTPPGPASAHIFGAYEFQFIRQNEEVAVDKHAVGFMETSIE